MSCRRYRRHLHRRGGRREPLHCQGPHDAARAPQEGVLAVTAAAKVAPGDIGLIISSTALRSPPTRGSSTRGPRPRCDDDLDYCSVGAARRGQPSRPVRLDRGSRTIKHPAAHPSTERHRHCGRPRYRAAHRSCEACWSARYSVCGCGWQRASGSLRSAIESSIPRFSSPACIVRFGGRDGATTIRLADWNA
jgi:hypothetical protein